MSLLRRSHPLLAAALVLVGCKSNAPAPASADAGSPAASAPSRTPTAPTPVPASGPMLSYLKPTGTEQCAWIRQPLPSGEPTPLFRFNADCAQSRVSWSPDGKEGLVFNWPVGPGAQTRIWRVDFAARTGKPLDLKELPGGTGEQGPDKPYVDGAGFDAQGRPVVLVSDVYVDRQAEKGQGGEQFLSFQGQRYPVPKGEGLPGLAFAYRLEGAGWKLLETKASLYETPSAPGTRVLEAARSMAGPTASEELPGQKATESAARMLDAALPQEETGQWRSLPTPGGTLHYRANQRPDDETLFYASTPVRWEQDGKLVELEGLKEQARYNRLGFHLQGGLLLVTAPSAAYVFDTRTKKNLLSLQEVESALFWPEPSSKP